MPYLQMSGSGRMDSEKQRQKDVGFMFDLIVTGCLLTFFGVYLIQAGLAEWIWILILVLAGISFVSAFYLNKRI